MYNLNCLFSMSCPRDQYAKDYIFIFHLGPLTLILSPLDDAAELCLKNSPIFGHLKLFRIVTEEY